MKKPLQIIAFILILATYGLVLTHKIQLLGDDLGRHLKNGELIFEDTSLLTSNFYSQTERDFPFINHHWGSGVLFHWIEIVGGLSGLVLFKVLLLLAMFSLLFLTALRKANFWLVAFFSLPVILLLNERTAVRPEILSFFFIALFLYLLIDLDDHPERKRIFWLIPLQLLWVNLHIFFIIGIMLVGGFLLEKIALHHKNFWRNSLVKKLALLTVTLVAVSFINPNGATGALYALSIFKHYAVTVSENLSPFSQEQFLWRNISFAVFTPMIALWLLSFIVGFRRKLIFYFIAGLGTIVAGLYILRNMPLFGLLFLPTVSANFNEVIPKIYAWFKKKWPAVGRFAEQALVPVVFSGIVFTAFLGYQSSLFGYRQPGLGLTSHSNDAANFIKEHGIRGPIFNDFDIGSYLIYHLFPQERPFVDNRPEAYPDQFFTDIYEPMLSGEDAWQKGQLKYGFKVIFMSQRNRALNVNQFIWRRLRDPAWALVYADTYAVIFLKNVPENQQLITQYSITRENISERISSLLEIPYPDGPLSAGHLFELIGRDDLAVAAYEKLVARWPNESPAWSVLGAIEVRKDTREGAFKAITDLQRAIDLGERTGENYTNLGLGYFKSAQFKEAKAAFDIALSIEPGREDVPSYLKQLEVYLRRK